MDYVAPAGWKFYGSNNGNQTTFTLPGHTVSAPYLAIFDRRVPSNSGGATTNPSYRVRFIRGYTDSEGRPLEARALVDINIRWPLASTPASVKELLAVASAALGNVDFQGDVVDEQLLPRSVASGT